jgi:hypothetical protein
MNSHEPDEGELYTRAREIIDQEWLAAGVTKEELEQSRQAAWAMASSPSAAPRRSRGETVPHQPPVAVPKRVPRPAAPGSPEEQPGELDRDRFDRLTVLVDDIEAELTAIRRALGAIREALHDSAHSSPHPD